MKIITMENLYKQAGPVTAFEWIEHHYLYKGVPLESMPIDDEVKKYLEGEFKKEGK